MKSKEESNINRQNGLDIDAATGAAHSILGSDLFSCSMLLCSVSSNSGVAS